MDANRFLTAVLPTTGFYCICEISTKYNQHRYVTSISEAIEKARIFDADGFNTYFAVASYIERGSRKLDNVQYLRSFFFDLDISATGKNKLGKPIYTSKRLAVEALRLFLQETGLDKLGKPWLLDSGGGVHVYWPLSEDIPLAEWQPLAERLKRTAVKHKLLIDAPITGDGARVMRMPGTMNQKYDPPKPASVKQAGDVFEFDDIDALLPQMSELGAFAPINGNHALTQTAIVNGIPGKRPVANALALPGKPPVAADAPAVGKALVQHVDSSFTKLLQRSLAADGNGCAQVRYFRDNADADGMEPMWRAMLSLAKCTTEGETAGREISSWHPYTEERFQKKWIELKGPLSCSAIDAINPGGCAGCPHAGKITNPLPIGRAVPLPAPIAATATAPALPALPSGFAFSKTATCRTVSNDDGNDLIPIIPFIFYLHSVMQEDDTYCARFCRVVSATEQHFIAIPMRALASKDDTIKELAKQNIFAAFGAGNDVHVFNYVRACAMEASTANTSLRVPAKYGWQPDESFACGERILSPAGEYTFVSNRLNNLIEGMQPAGTFSNWQRVLTMLCNKGCYDVVSLALIGFASPLMAWANNGADAMTFHATSRESGVGKSLALSIARSTWGGKRLIVVPNTSENTMLQRAGLLGGLPLLVDEVTAKNRSTEMEWIPKFLFDYAQGQHKLKGSSSANAELNDNMTWNGLAFITSNSPVLEHMLGARDTSSNGEVQRFLEWRCETKIDFNEHERDIMGLLNSNYGHAGPMFADWLVNNMARAKSVFATILEGWRKAINAIDSERYWVAGCAAIIAAATLLGPLHANICAIDVRRVMAFLTGLIERTRSLIDSNLMTANDVVSSFLREFNGMFVKVGKAGSVASSISNNGLSIALPDSARGKVVGRIELEMSPGQVCTYLDVTALKKYCSMRNWSYTALKDDLSHNAVVQERAIDLFRGTSMAASTTRCLQIIYASTNAPAHAS
jgi:hypothetical protein